MTPTHILKLAVASLRVEVTQFSKDEAEKRMRPMEVSLSSVLRVQKGSPRVTYL
jgi:hypothetical protein